jgi:allophanate hydrolase
LATVDLALTPTIPRAFTVAELQAEPIRRNSELGTYTNFMNLLDYAAVTLPAARMRSGLPWGPTLFGRAFSDQYLLAIAGRFLAAEAGVPTSRRELIANDRIRVVVCGAHLQGLALNHQLLDRAAVLVRATRTAPSYRLYALPGGPPFRPALVRDASGRCIEVEIWEMPSSELGSFLNGIAAPLGLGKVELSDGSVENAFICEHGALDGALDITEFGGWRAYLDALAKP